MNALAPHQNARFKKNRVIRFRLLWCGLAELLYFDGHCTSGFRYRPKGRLLNVRIPINDTFSAFNPVPPSRLHQEISIVGGWNVRRINKGRPVLQQ
jgi:hypothetical protein